MFYAAAAAAAATATTTTTTTTNCYNNHNNCLHRTAFRRELSRLRRLQHSHIVRLIAVCCDGGEDRLYGVVVEYPVYGDLKRYLRQHVVTTAAAVDATGTKSLLNTGTTSFQPLSSSSLTLVTSTT